MRVIALVFGVLISFSSFSQKKLVYDDIIQDLISNKDSIGLYISYYSPNLEKKELPFIIEIVYEETLVDIPTLNEDGEQLSFDIIAHDSDRTEFIEYFESSGLLNKLYFRANKEYINLKNLDDKFLLEDPILIIELMIGSEKLGLLQLYIPIYSIEEAIEILTASSRILDNKYRKTFRVLMKEMKQNATQQVVNVIAAATIPLRIYSMKNMYI